MAGAPASTLYSLFARRDTGHRQTLHLGHGGFYRKRSILSSRKMPLDGFDHRDLVSPLANALGHRDRHAGARLVGLVARAENPRLRLALLALMRMLGNRHRDAEVRPCILDGGYA